MFVLPALTSVVLNALAIFIYLASSSDVTWVPIPRSSVSLDIVVFCAGIRMILLIVFTTIFYRKRHVNIILPVLWEMANLLLVMAKVGSFVVHHRQPGMAWVILGACAASILLELACLKHLRSSAGVLPRQHVFLFSAVGAMTTKNMEGRRGMDRWGVSSSLRVGSAGSKGLGASRTVQFSSELLGGSAGSASPEEGVEGGGDSDTGRESVGLQRLLPEKSVRSTVFAAGDGSSYGEGDEGDPASAQVLRDRQISYDERRRFLANWSSKTEDMRGRWSSKIDSMAGMVSDAIEESAARCRAWG
ncbi:unnamed protein product, partial [Discosporangium mesarthrocarpum]